MYMCNKLSSNKVLMLNSLAFHRRIELELFIRTFLKKKELHPSATNLFLISPTFKTTELQYSICSYDISLHILHNCLHSHCKKNIAPNTLYSL